MNLKDTYTDEEISALEQQTVALPDTLTDEEISAMESQPIAPPTVQQPGLLARAVDAIGGITLSPSANPVDGPVSASESPFGWIANKLMPPGTTVATNPIESVVRNEASAGNPIAEGIWQGANDIGGLAARVGAGDADALNTMQNAETERFKQATGDAFIPRAVAGAARSMTMAAPVALGAGLAAPAVGIEAATGAMWAPIAAATATTANQAVSEGRQAGLTGWQLAGHVAGQAIPEAAIAGGMNIVGAGGMEKVFGGFFKQGAKQTGKQLLAQLGFDFGAEQLEENATSVAQAVMSRLSGVDPNALTWDSLGRIIADTTAQTAIGVGPVQLAQAARNGIAGQEPAPLPSAAELNASKDGLIPTADILAQYGPEIAADAGPGLIQEELARRVATFRGIPVPVGGPVSEVPTIDPGAAMQGDPEAVAALVAKANAQNAQSVAQEMAQQATPLRKYYLDLIAQGASPEEARAKVEARRSNIDPALKRAAQVLNNQSNAVPAPSDTNATPAAVAPPETANASPEPTAADLGMEEPEPIPAEGYQEPVLQVGGKALTLDGDEVTVQRMARGVVVASGRRYRAEELQPIYAQPTDQPDIPVDQPQVVTQQDRPVDTAATPAATAPDRAGVARDGEGQAGKQPVAAKQTDVRISIHTPIDRRTPWEERPWEYELDDYASAQAVRNGRHVTGSNLHFIYDAAAKTHRKAVESARDRGETIPPSVQADYPDLFPNNQTAEPSKMVEPPTGKEQPRQSATPTTDSTPSTRFSSTDAPEATRNAPNTRDTPEARAIISRAVEDTATALSKAHKGANQHVVFDSADQLPESLRDGFEAEKAQRGEGGEVHGLYDPATGTTYLHRPDIIARARRQGTSVEFATEQTWLHETGTHYGSDLLFGRPEFRVAHLNRVYNEHKAEILADQMPDAPEPRSRSERATLVEEWLAPRIEAATTPDGFKRLTNADKGLLRPVWQGIRRILRKAGIVSKYNEFELNALANSMYQGVLRGKGQATGGGGTARFSSMGGMFRKKNAPDENQKGWGPLGMSERAHQAISEGKRTSDMISKEYGVRRETVEKVLPRPREWHHVLRDDKKTPDIAYFYDFDPKSDPVDKSRLEEIRAMDAGRKTDAIEKRTRTLAVKRLGLSVEHNKLGGTHVINGDLSVGSFMPWGFDATRSQDADSARRVAEVFGFVEDGTDSGVYISEKEAARTGSISAPMDGTSTSDQRQSTPSSPDSQPRLSGYTPPRVRVEDIPKPVALPELTNLTRELLGSVPGVLERLRIRGGRAFGVFHGSEAGLDITPAGRIDLKADIFIGPQLAARRTRGLVTAKDLADFRKDVLANSDVSPDDLVIRRAKNGRTFGLIAYQRDHAYAARTLAHEIGHAMDWLPTADLKRGNLLGHIAALHKYISSTVGTVNAALTPEQRAEMRKDVEKTVRAAGTPSSDKGFAAAVAKEMRARIASQGLFDNREIRDELKALTHWWKPFDADTVAKEYKDYRYSPAELYADALSVMFNQPEQLTERAPRFWQAFNEFADARPEVKAALDAIQSEIQTGNTPAARLARERQAMAMDEKRRTEIAGERAKDGKTRLRDMPKALAWAAWDNTVYVPKAAKQAMQDIAYSGSNAMQYFRDVDAKALKILRDADVDLADFGVFVKNRRAAHERADLANPGGIRGVDAESLLDTLRADVGPEKYDAMERAAAGVFEARKQNVIGLLEKSRLFSDDLMDKIRTNEEYFKFQVQEYLDAKNSGPGNGTAHIYHQIGTLKDVSNPLYPTIIQDVSLIHAALTNTAKREVVAALSGTDALTEAKRGANGEWANPPDGTQGLLVLAEDGKQKGYYVDGHIADLFKHDPMRARVLWNVLQVATVWPKRILTSNNPFFGLWNITRDFQSSLVKLPGNPMTAVPKLLWNYAATARDAARHAFMKESTERVARMMQDGELIAGRQWDAMERDDVATELERYAALFDANPMRQEAFWKRAGRAVFDDWNSFLESWGKIAGDRYLEGQGITGAERVRLVRERAGSPNFLARGQGTKWLNSIFMFSNARAQGLRQTVGAFKDTPVSTSIKFAMYAIAPSLLMNAMAKGLLGDDDEEKNWLKQAFDCIGEFDKRNYLCIPLWSDGKRTGYTRIPMDHTGHVVHTALWDALNSEDPAAIADAAGQIAGQFPWTPDSLTPALGVANDLFWYANGFNPQDSYKGQPAINQTVFAAGGSQKHVEMAKYEWNKSPAGTLYRFDPPFDVRSKSALDKALSFPGLAQFKRFYKETDQGIGDAERFAEQAKSAGNAVNLIAAKDVAAEAVGGAETRAGAMSALVKSYRDARDAGLLPSPKEYKFSQYREVYKNLVDKRFGEGK